jgi:hypothetical protein
MRSLFEITNVVCHDAPPTDRILGLLAYATVHMGPFRIDGLQVRRDRAGQFFVKWSAHKDAAGIEHPHLEILDLTIRPAIHAAVERAVLAVARREGRIP